MRLLISGIPGTGKSTFAHWLAESHGFFHVDVDHSVGRSFEDLLTEPRLVIDWGFPVEAIANIEKLIACGVENWWFDGDRDAALASFLRRATVPKSAWDKQLGDIARCWPEIERLFSGRILNVVSAGPVHMPMEERYQRLMQ